MRVLVRHPCGRAATLLRRSTSGVSLPGTRPAPTSVCVQSQSPSASLLSATGELRIALAAPNGSFGEIDAPPQVGESGGSRRERTASQTGRRRPCECQARSQPQPGSWLPKIKCVSTESAVVKGLLIGESGMDAVSLTHDSCSSVCRVHSRLIENNLLRIAQRTYSFNDVRE